MRCDHSSSFSLAVMSSDCPLTWMSEICPKRQAGGRCLALLPSLPHTHLSEGRGSSSWANRRHQASGGRAGPLGSLLCQGNCHTSAQTHSSQQLPQCKLAIPDRNADTWWVPWTPCWGEGPGAHPAPPHWRVGLKRAAGCLETWAQNKAVMVGAGADQSLSGCRLGVGSLGLGMVCLAAWPGHAGTTAPAWPCTESHPSGLACQPVWLSAHPPAWPCLSVGLHACVTQLRASRALHAQLSDCGFLCSRGGNG